MAQQGNHDEAFEVLRKAVNDGWNMSWRFDVESPTLDSIRERPEFIEIGVDLEADMAAQLEQLQELERTGELAPIPATLL